MIEVCFTPFLKTRFDAMPSQTPSAAQSCWHPAKPSMMLSTCSAFSAGTTTKFAFQSLHFSRIGIRLVQVSRPGLLRALLSAATGLFKLSCEFPDSSIFVAQLKGETLFGFGPGQGAHLFGSVAMGVGSTAWRCL